MARYIDADLIEYHEEYDGQGFTRVAYADDIENLPTVELFDKERLKFVIEKNFGHGTIEPILQLIDAQPTADVVEVVYGEWVPNESDRHHHCSVCMEDALCKEDWQFLDCVEILSEYCPNCGAKMSTQSNAFSTH